MYRNAVVNNIEEHCIKWCVKCYIPNRNEHLSSQQISEDLGTIKENKTENPYQNHIKGISKAYQRHTRDAGNRAE